MAPATALSQLSTVLVNEDASPACQRWTGPMQWSRLRPTKRAFPLVDQIASRRRTAPNSSQRYTKVALNFSGIPHSTQYCMVRWMALSSPISGGQRSRWQALRAEQMIPFNIDLRVSRLRLVFLGGSNSKMDSDLRRTDTYQLVPCLSIVPHHPT